MKRTSPWILVAIVIGAVGLGFGAFRLGNQLCTVHLTRNADDLEWLRSEFKLSEAQMAEVRKLHEGYLPQCQEYCSEIAKARAELDAALASGVDSSAVQPKLTRIAMIRVQCQTAMLRHFEEVSRAMPPEQGRRYLAEMQNMTLGSHESIERSMSQGTSDPHAGHHH